MLTYGLEKTVELLKDKGVRLTPQRQAVLEYLDETVSHPTAEDIYRNIRRRFQGVSLATVYNIMNLFKEMGIVLELKYGDMASRFDGNFKNHYHISCIECGRVFDYDRPLVEGLEEEAAKMSGFKIHGHRLEFIGTCPDCQKGESGLKA